MKLTNGKVHHAFAGKVTLPVNLDELLLSEKTKTIQEAVKSYAEKQTPKKSRDFHLAKKSTVLAVVCDDWKGLKDERSKHLWVTHCSTTELAEQLTNPVKGFESFYIPVFKDVPEILALEVGTIVAVDITKVTSGKFAKGVIRKIFFKL